MTTLKTFTITTVWVFLTVILGISTACQTNNSNNLENDSNNSLQGISSTLEGANPDAVIRPNSLPEENLLISLDDLFTEDQMKSWKNKKFMALVYDSSSKVYSLLKLDNLPEYTSPENNENLHPKAVNTMMVSEDGKVGYEFNIKQIPKQKVLFLISNLYMQKEIKNLKNEFEWGFNLESGKSTGFYVGKQYYRLNAYSRKGMENDRPAEFDYQLELEVAIEGVKDMFKTELSYIPYFDDGQVQVLFVGDLDGDNLPEWIIDNNYKYTNVGLSGVLFSTKASGKGQPKPISQQNWGHLRGEELHSEGC